MGAFSQDVSALSHEVGEWADDPLVVNINGNNTPCGTLEVGNPLENNSNLGGYPYTVNGFTYNLAGPGDAGLFWRVSQYVFEWRVHLPG